MIDIWNIERTLWLDGVNAYWEHFAQDCLMAFGPAGILRGQQIIHSLQHAPRWSEVSFDDTSLIQPAAGVAVIAYRAHAERNDTPPYQALCTSTYVRSSELIWQIAQHQQTPLAEQQVGT